MALAQVGAYTSAYDGQSLSQAVLATNPYLQTNAYGGTNWNPAEMAPTLNKWLNSGFYLTTPSPSGGQLSSFVVTDVNLNCDATLNIYEASGNRTRLQGHPLGSTIRHWVALVGYNGWQGSGNASSLTVNDDAYPNAFRTAVPQAPYPPASLASMSQTYGSVW